MFSKRALSNLDFGGIYAPIMVNENVHFSSEIVAQTYSLSGWDGIICATYVSSLRMKRVTRLSPLVRKESNFSYSDKRMLLGNLDSHITIIGYLYLKASCLKSDNRDLNPLAFHWKTVAFL